MRETHCPCGIIYRHYGHEEIEFCPDCQQTEEKFQASGPRYDRASAGRAEGVLAPASAGPNQEEE